MTELIVFGMTITGGALVGIVVGLLIVVRDHDQRIHKLEQRPTQHEDRADWWRN